jgi:RNA polymerase sigma-70 factor (ECF subfamily)
VLGFSAKEVAEMLDTTTAAANSALQRARAAIDGRFPDVSQQETLRSLGDEAVRDLVERFIDAFEGGDIEAIVAVLAEDVAFAMPPYAAWARGRDAVAQSWLMPTRVPPCGTSSRGANGQLALGAYALREGGRFAPIALDVLTLRGAEIVQVIAFRTLEASLASACPPSPMARGRRPARGPSAPAPGDRGPRPPSCPRRSPRANGAVTPPARGDATLGADG